MTGFPTLHVRYTLQAVILKTPKAEPVSGPRGARSFQFQQNSEFIFILFIQTYFPTSHSGTYHGNGKSHIHYYTITFQDTKDQLDHI